MLKKFLNKNQALPLYVLSNIVLISVPLIYLAIDIYSKKTYNCYNSIGSFTKHTCTLGEYAFDYLFWVVIAIIYIQTALIPAAIITYALMKLLQLKYPNISKKKTHIKFLFALLIYSISTFLIGIISDGF